MGADARLTAPYDQRAARWLAPWAARAGLHPNQVTLLSLGLALGAGILFASGEYGLCAWGAGLFVAARFLDHLDGEVARLSGRTSRLGYHLDYATGAVSYAVIFVGMGLGLTDTLGPAAMVLGGMGAAAALGAWAMNLELDRSTGVPEGESIGYPRAAGLELEDGIYLLAPVTWLGWLAPFFVLAGIGAAVYALWTARRLIRARRTAELG